MCESVLLQREIDTLRVVHRQIHNRDFSKVYEATDNLDAHIALKIVNEEAVSESDSTFHEGLRQLRHENICRVLAAGKLEDGRTYYCLEWADGGSLEGLLKIPRLIAQSEVIRYAIGIVRGLRYLEDNGVLHGDIKPGNILLTQNGTIKLSDFGLAVGVRQGQAGSNVTYRLHRSPEIVEAVLAGRPYKKTIQSDIYALGVTLFRLVNGNAGIEYAANPTDLCEQVKSGRFPDRTCYPVYTSGKLIRLINKAMHPDLKKRFVSFHEVESTLIRLDCGIDWQLVTPIKYNGFDKSKEVEYTLRLTELKRGANRGRYSVVAKVRKKNKVNWKHLDLQPMFIDDLGDAKVLRSLFRSIG